MVSIHVLATPIRGRLRSASVNPMALNMERAPARSRPSVIPRLMCLRSIVRDYRTRNAVVKLRIGLKENGEPVVAADSPRRYGAAQNPLCPSRFEPTPGPRRATLHPPRPQEDVPPSTPPDAPCRN